MPCRKKKSKREGKKLQWYVVGLYNFDPASFESARVKEPNFAAPDVSSQLPFTRGDRLIVVSEELDWWIYCRSIHLQKEGYVPTELLAPLCTRESDESSDSQDLDTHKTRKKLVPCDADCIDLKYFPNAPTISGVHQLRKPCPEAGANILSRLTFWWMTGMIVSGYKRPLEDGDLWALPAPNQVVHLGRILKKEWDKETTKAKTSDALPSSQIQSTSKDSGIEEKETLLVETPALEKSESRREEMDEQPPVEIRSGRIRSKSYKPSFAKALIRSYGLTFLFGAFFKLLYDVLVFASPYLLRLIIAYVEGEGPQETWRGYMYAALLFVVALCQSLLLHQYFHRAFVTGMRARSGTLALIYRKMLLLKNSSRKDFTVGEMVNLMSVDATKLQDITTYLNMLWSAPLQIVVALYFLYDTMGWSIFAGVGVMILLMPVNLYVSKKAKSLQVKQMAKKDKRSKLMNEILNGIKVLKLYAWENSFMQKVFDVRKEELKELKSAMYLSAGFSFTYTCAPFMVSVATFAVYVLIGNELTASKAFVGISLFNILRFPMSMLPMLITSFVQCRVSLVRISKFLQAEELVPDAVKLSNDTSCEEAMAIEDGTFTWGEPGAATLSNIDLKVKRGELIAVVGAVGSGKSSLLSALLGEMEKLKGNVSMNGKVAYVSQQAWIQNATLQDNVLFGRKFKKTKYENVIDSCSLRSDLELLPVGDMTEIGEKGINLSGGQKQRVSIARAVYANADIYLLDDPLSAVDAHVARHIFDEVIGPEGMLRNKVRILVTHGLSYLADVDRIVVLQNGRISETGTYQELLENGDAFADFLRMYLVDAGEDLENIEEEEGLSRKDSIIAKLARRISEESFVSDKGGERELISEHSYPDIRNEIGLSRLRSYTESAAFEDGEIDELLHKHVVQQTQLEKKKDATTITQETSQTGHVKIHVFVSYAKAIGIFLSILVVLTTFVFESFAVGSRIWLAKWSSAGEISDKKRNLYLGVYGGLGFAQALFVLANAYLLAFSAFRASRDLHNKLLVNVLHCPMSFFETTPMGRIVNRFSSDINKIDEVIPHSIRSFLGTFAAVFGTLFVISYTTPIFLAVLAPLLVLYVVTQRFYVSTSRQLKRLEAVKKSPIYNHFFESINGVSTIRAYKEQERFILDSESRVDENQAAYYPSVSANRWLAVRLEFVGNCIVLFAALFAINQKDKLSSGLVGLSITYALNITQTLNWMVRMTSELETNIVSVERVKEYADIEGEAPWEIAEHKPKEEWPDQGIISFDNYSVRYRKELDLVLKDIQFDTRKGEKVGVVGRTGAGKSSIALALFRIIEAAGGSIVIDGIDIGAIGLHNLRSKLTIIPQDPVLFSGSLRFNLDPFSSYTDDELWYALEVAHLKEFVSQLGAKLEHEITEGGENLSVGQRQLICLARAILRKTRILVLDEATAAVDMETDELIQGTIRNEFKDCTIITIAHRLNTIMDYNRIMVLDKGAIVEFAPPSQLLADKKSRFYAMAKDSGLV